MAEKSKISEQEKFYLDTYGYAQLGAENRMIQGPSMREMYGTFLDAEDPVIAKTLNEASMAEAHLMKKQQYDTTPEDKRGEMQDPGKINEQLGQSLQARNSAATMYTQKRLSMFHDLTATQALSYHSNDAGSAIIATPTNVKNAIGNTSKKIGKLGQTGAEGAVYDAVSAMDQFFIHGKLNAEVQHRTAEETIKRSSEALERLANSEQ